MTLFDRFRSLVAASPAPAVPSTAVPAAPLPLLDRVVLAGALGDAWGYAVEFDSVAAMDQRFGPGAPGLHQPPSSGPLMVSDDTQMSLFTLDGLRHAQTLDETLGGPGTALALLRAYQAWYSTQHHRTEEPGAWYDLAVMRQRQAPGNTCLSALRAHRQGPVPTPINSSKGCGGVMRTAVIGAWPGMTPDLAWSLGDTAAALTHGHPDGRWPSAWIAAWVARAGSSAPGPMTGRPTPDQRVAFLAAWDAEADRLNRLDGASGTARLMHEARTLDTVRPWAQAWDVLGQGWVGDEALAIAAYAVRRADSFDDAVFRAVYHDGDSDSTGALAAQLWAAWFGVPDAARPWLDRLDVLPAWRRLQALLPVR